MTPQKEARGVDTAPESEYPDRGCISWPSCLSCIFDPCINTTDKEPTRLERERATTRREIVHHYHDDMLQKDIAVTLGIDLGVVERGIAKYKADIERANRKALELRGLPILEVIHDVTSL